MTAFKLRSTTHDTGHSYSYCRPYSPRAHSINERTLYSLTYYGCLQLSAGLCLSVMSCG